MIQAVIFDMDGVISDSQKLHAEAESQLLARYGISMRSEEITARYAGVSDDKMFIEIFNQNEKPLPPVEKLIADKWQIMAKSAKAVKAVPGSQKLIQKLAAINLSLAVASSSPHDFINHVLSSLNLNSYFNVRVSADDVKNGKPSPDIFLKAADQLGIDPEVCVVIEDAVSGITGAKKARMSTIAFNLDSVDADYKAANHQMTYTAIQRLLK